MNEIREKNDLVKHETNNTHRSNKQNTLSYLQSSLFEIFIPFAQVIFFRVRIHLVGLISLHLNTIRRYLERQVAG